ncbi:MAG: nuclear transport factor 2 family protein [Gemmatimonadota bacterium]|nr:nuclear transport factor 2 family protein [Gemmatimonadota bacterium]
MRAASGILLALLLSLSRADSQAPSARGASAAERVLFRLEDEWAAALVRRDAAAFRRLIAPEWVYTDERGQMAKAAAIEEFTGGADTVTAASNEGMRAQVYGNAAVVTGVLVTAGRGRDGAFRHRYRFTDTWIRRGHRWECVASQDYDIPRG